MNHFRNHAVAIFLVFFTSISMYTGPLSGKTYHGTIGLVPYKNTANPSMARAYTKLVYVSSIINKGIELHSPVDLERDLNRLGKKISSSISSKDLIHIGTRRGLDYIILGSVTKTSGGYRVKSVVFSVANEQVVDNYSLHASSLVTLSDKEINRAFIGKPGRSQHHSTETDTAIIMESSQDVHDLWTSLREGVIQFASRRLETQGINGRLWLVPVSSRHPVQRTVIAERSSLPIKTWFSQHKPAGRAMSTHLEKALSYTLQSLKWRKNSTRECILVTATGYPELPYSRFSRQLKSRGIRVTLIDLRGSYHNISGPLYDLVRTTGGAWHTVTYRKKVFNLRGKPVYLFLQSGRLFSSIQDDINWSNGILRGSGRYARALPGLDEIYNTGKEQPDRKNMHLVFTAGTSTGILKSTDLQSNLADILSINLSDKKPLLKKGGRVLVSDGTVSLWVRVNQQELNFLSKQKDYLYLPVRAWPGYSSTYNITLEIIPHEIPGYMVPAKLKKTLGELVKAGHTGNQQRYFLSRVKVIRIENDLPQKDIRDLQ